MEVTLLPESLTGFSLPRHLIENASLIGLSRWSLSLKISHSRNDSHLKNLNGSLSMVALLQMVGERIFVSLSER